MDGMLTKAPLSACRVRQGTVELTKEFKFDAAHTLRRVINTESSLRIHGHSYRAQVALRGRPDPVSGMIIDLGDFEKALEGVRDALDHRFLDEINDLGPGTMENLVAWIWDRLEPELVGLHRVTVMRDSAGETCSYWGPEEDQA